jgi:hypothetical protein
MLHTIINDDVSLKAKPLADLTPMIFGLKAKG